MIITFVTIPIIEKRYELKQYFTIFSSQVTDCYPKEVVSSLYISLKIKKINRIVTTS